ncbi:MAG: hypothetical protein HKN44_14120 [Ilumatobacter sp.]|nr:hypothetical protein [Ilumatobacter sp.]
MTHRGRTLGDPWRALLVVVAAAAVLGAAIVFVLNAAATTSARVAATTSSEGLLTTATINLSQPGSAVDLLLDGDGLYPGVPVDGCVVIEYAGTIPVTVRLHGTSSAGSGLDPYVDFRLTELDANSCPDAAAEQPGTRAELYAGRLDVFWSQHGSFASGVEVDRPLVSGDRIAVSAEAIVTDDNRAQGQSTDFTLTIEARPA